MHHALHVLRMKEGDFLQLTNGEGAIIVTEIISAGKKVCVVKTLATHVQEKKYSFTLHIAIAPTKSSDRLSFFLEKVTELGIDEISFLLCNNSERRKVNHEKELQTLISAMKQSKYAYLPKLNIMKAFDDFIQEQSLNPAQKFIAHCRETGKKNFSKTLKPGKDILLLIGPEGDFTEQEIFIAGKNNFIPVSLGESRLRTETAGIAACVITHVINEMENGK
jgi:16S rRNA (uracil1498-N3)-methyltransferase